MDTASVSGYHFREHETGFSPFNNIILLVHFDFISSHLATNSCECLPFNTLDILCDGIKPYAKESRLIIATVHQKKKKKINT